MTTTPFRSDFYATERAHVPLKDAVEMRNLSRLIESEKLRRCARLGMRAHAKDAVVAARKYRKGRT